MKDKPDNDTPDSSADDMVSNDAGSDNGYMVEEHVLERSQYDNTISFQMDVEKVKEMAQKQPQELERAVEEELSAQSSSISEEEKERIRQSLAEMREVEQEELHGSGSKGLLGRLIGLFTGKS